MRNYHAIYLVVALTLLSTLAMVSCSGFFVSENSIDTVSVSPPGALLKQGETLNVTASAKQVNKTANDVTTQSEWSSDTTDVATVDSTGKITAGTTNGNANIKAKYSGKTGNALIMVTGGTFPTSLAVQSSTTTTLTINTPVTFHAFINVNSTITDITTAVTWSSSNAGIAAVDSNGNVLGISSCGATIGTSTCPTITASFATTSSPITGQLQITSIQ